MSRKNVVSIVMLCLGVLLFACSGALPAHALSTVIDHTNWNWYDTQSQAVFDAVGTQSVFFSHASVGSNIVGGMNTLRSSDSSKYQLQTVSAGTTPPAVTQPGRFYEYARGNPGWEQKINLFNSYVGNGWSSPKVAFAMDKLCYIDEQAKVSTYLNAMQALSAANPTTKLVYWTMPLTTSTQYDNVLRNLYNNSIRDYAKSHDIILMDIADIEAWSPSGVQQTFIYDGVTYQKLFSGYTGDGGHLNALASQRVATGIYSLVGKSTVAPEPSTMALVFSGLAGLAGLRKRRKK